MGDQKDVLEGMTKFSGNDGAVVWPMWKDDLMNRVKFELGTVAVRILEGKIRKDQVKIGVRIKAIQSLVNMVMARNRALVTFRAEWMEKSKKKQDDGAVQTDYVLTMVGEMGLKTAISKTKSSYFKSIEKYGLAEGSKVLSDYKKLKLKYDETTMPEWLDKMDRLYGVNHRELFDAYVEQLTSLRVIKMTEDADVLRNLLNQDTMDDLCHGFECFHDKKHTITQLSEGITSVKDKITALRKTLEKVEEPECMEADVIVPKIIQKLKFLDDYAEPIKEYAREYGKDKANAHDLDHFFLVLHTHETEYCRFVKQRKAQTMMLILNRAMTNAKRS